MTDRIGIERLCVFGMSPVEFITLARSLGCGFVGIGLTPMRGYNPHNYADWSLKTDAGLRRDTIAALRDQNVVVSLCEGFGVRPGADVAALATDLDIAQELGAERINAVSIDPDIGRTLDQFARLAEMAEAREIETTIEIGPGPMANLAAGLAAMRHVGRASFRLLIDTMHFFRFGGTVEDIVALDPGAIGYVQLCDAPKVSTFKRYMDEALYERLPPGAGELPLRAFIAAIPRDVILSLEVPQRSLAAAGVGPRERVSGCVSAARKLLAENAN